MLPIDDLERRSELADARLGVAEDLAWPMSMVAATAVHLAWDNWYFNVAALGVTYFVSTLKYRREASKAEDEYYRRAKLGKYVAGDEKADR